jgi:L-Ala-D/L-Glu epimerase
VKLNVHLEEWAIHSPFRIAGHIWDNFRVVVVELSDGSHVGRGEGSPVYYLNESADSLYRQIETLRPDIEQGITRESLLNRLPPGGARNAIDAALWDLEAKRSGRTIWSLTGIDPKPVTTVLTIGLGDSPQEMAQRAAEAPGYPRLKIKVDRNAPIERIAAIREARPETELFVDANQAWTFEELSDWAPQLVDLNVTLIEQPLPRGGDQSLEHYTSPIPLCADESCQHRGELDEASRRYQIINIKLDKAGGLTEALYLARAVEERGLQTLVSCMAGTSLGLAPAFVLAQRCQYVELDAHLFLRSDRVPPLPYRDGRMTGLDPRLWG